MDSRNDLHSGKNPKWSELPAGRQKLGDRGATRRYVEEIDGSADGHLCVLYLDGSLNLIGAMKWCGERAPVLDEQTPDILRRGKEIGAAGFILARRSPGEKYYPDPPTVLATGKLRRVSADLDLPLLDYLVFPLGQVVSIGGLQPSDS
jgi:DNA repair protein RadC